MNMSLRETCIFIGSLSLSVAISLKPTMFGNWLLMGLGVFCLFYLYFGGKKQ